MWDPALYQRFADERSRPFTDLLARVGAEAPRAVVDLGCGPGTLTATLARRWPGARVTGLDSSAEMIDRALRAGHGLPFHRADLRDWQPGADVDVMVANAVLQWVPDHERLLTAWAARLSAGAWLAVQVPGNFDAPSHRALREVGADPRWRARVGPLLRESPVADPAGYAALLLGAGCSVDAWETTYVHQLPDAGALDAHPVLRWLEGTALRPVHAALADDPAGWHELRAALDARLRRAYPARDGVVLFPFRRIFFVARTGAGALGAP